MKKMKAFSCLLLCILLIPACVVKGESAYTALRALFSSNNEELWYLGEGVSIAGEKDGQIWVVYNEKEKAFFLRGVNEYDQGEVTVWQDVEMLTGYRLIYTLCSIWDTLQANMEQGYTITLAITEMEQVEGAWVINNAEAAASFVSVVDNAFASMPAE